MNFWDLNMNAILTFSIALIAISLTIIALKMFEGSKKRSARS